MKLHNPGLSLCNGSSMSDDLLLLKWLSNFVGHFEMLRLMHDKWGSKFIKNKTRWWSGNVHVLFMFIFIEFYNIFIYFIVGPMK